MSRIPPETDPISHGLLVRLHEALWQGGASELTDATMAQRCAEIDVLSSSGYVDTIRAFLLDWVQASPSLTAFVTLVLRNIDMADWQDDQGNNLAHLAMASGQWQLAKQLLTEFPALNRPNRVGLYPQDIALSQPGLSQAYLFELFGSTERVDYADDKGKTPLMRALDVGYSDVACMLMLEKGAAVHATDVDGKDALDHLYSSQHLHDADFGDALSGLLFLANYSVEADFVNRMPLMKPSMRSDSEYIQFVSLVFRRMKNCGQGALRHRLFNRFMADAAAMKALPAGMNFEIDVNAEVPCGVMPHWQEAIRAKNTDAVRVLNRMGLDWSSAKNAAGQSPFEYAIAQGIRDVDFLMQIKGNSQELLQIQLLDARQRLRAKGYQVPDDALLCWQGVDADEWCRPIEDWFPDAGVSAAAGGGELPAPPVASVCSSGVFARFDSERVRSAIIRAITARQWHALPRLCDDKMCMRALTPQGELPLGFAVRMGVNDPSVLAHLLPSGRVVDCVSMPDVYGRTALVKAISNADSAQIRCLRDHGASLSVEDLNDVDVGPVESLTAISLFYPPLGSGAGDGEPMPASLDGVLSRMGEYNALHDELSALRQSITRDFDCIQLLPDLADRFEAVAPGSEGLTEMAGMLRTIAARYAHAASNMYFKS